MKFTKVIVLAVTALSFLLVGYFQGYLHGASGTLSNLKGVVSDAVNIYDARAALMRTLKVNAISVIGPLTVAVDTKPFGMHIRRGTVIVEEVFPGFPAEKLGVREGCIIFQIAGQKVIQGTWLASFQKTPMPFNITFGCPPQTQAGFGPLSHDKHNYRVMVVKRPFGMNVQVHQVPRVVEVLPGSAAERAGVKRGFVLKSVNDAPVDAESWAAAWQHAEMPFILAFDTDVPLQKDNPFIDQTTGEWMAGGHSMSIDDLDDDEDDDGEEITVTVNELPFGMEVNAPPGKLPTIKSVVEGLPAQKAGIKPGDIILQIAGRYVESSSWFAAFQHAVPPFGLRLRRPDGEDDDLDEDEDDEGDNLTVTVREKPFGMHVRRGGNVVEEVFPKFPAQKAGVRKGCMIKEIKNKTVSQGTWMEIFKKATLPFSLKLVCPKKGAAKKRKRQSRGPIQREVHNFTVKVSKRPFGMNIHSSVLPRVVEVLPGYPAEAAGVKAGFVLTKINKLDVNATNWFDVWQRAPLGSVLTFNTNMPRAEEEEDDEEDDTDDKDDDDDKDSKTSKEFGELDVGEGFTDFKCAVKNLPFGMQIVAPKGGRPTVKNVTKGLPAEKQGIKPGDVLVEVAGLPVSVRSWFTAFQQGVPPFGLRFRRPDAEARVLLLKKHEDEIASASKERKDERPKEADVLRPSQQNATRGQTGFLKRV